MNARRVDPLRRAAVAAFLLVAAAPDRAALSDCAPIPVAPGGTLQSVAQDLGVNGIPMAIQLYKSTMTPAQLLAFYRRQWAGQGARPGNIEYDVAPWKVIAAARDGCFYTVQTQAGAAGRGSTALLGVSRAAGGGAAPGADFPQMAGSTVRNDYASDDSGKRGRLLVLSNHYSSNGNATFYRDQLARAGWTLVRQQAPVAGRAQALVLTFRRRGGWLDMTINQEAAATVLVVNIND